MKKWIVAVLAVLVLGSVWIFTNRYIARQAIDDYMHEQKIDKKDILVDDFRKDWDIGGYKYFVSIKGEDPGIYYMYHYDNREIMFDASRMPEEWIKEKTWGGAYLTETELETIKYPPLKEK